MFLGQDSFFVPTDPGQPLVQQGTVEAYTGQQGTLTSQGVTVMTSPQYGNIDLAMSLYGPTQPSEVYGPPLLTPGQTQVVYGPPSPSSGGVNWKYILGGILVIGVIWGTVYGVKRARAIKYKTKSLLTKHLKYPFKIRRTI